MPWQIEINYYAEHFQTWIRPRPCFSIQCAARTVTKIWKIRLGPCVFCPTHSNGRSWHWRGEQQQLTRSVRHIQTTSQRHCVRCLSIGIHLKWRKKKLKINLILVHRYFSKRFGIVTKFFCTITKCMYFKCTFFYRWVHRINCIQNLSWNYFNKIDGVFITFINIRCYFEPFMCSFEFVRSWK